MRFPLLSLILALALALAVKANVEKRVFWAPEDSDTPEFRQVRRELIESGIEVLSPQSPRMQRKIHAAFPHSPPGLLGEPNQVWILLDELEKGRIYDLRLSFSAMQPSTQNLTHHSISAWKEQEHKENIQRYLETRTNFRVPSTAVSEPSRPNSQHGLFFVGVDPNYFTIDQTMMNDGILVEFSFILDPYILNVLPASTVPLSIYITILAAIAFPLSSFIWRSLQFVARLENEARPRTGDQNKDD